MSRWVASTLSDEHYFAAQALFPTTRRFRSRHGTSKKIITLCVLYCIDFREFLRASRLPLDYEGRDPIPDELVPRQLPKQSHGRVPSEEESRQRHGLLDSLMKQWEESPLFLRHSLNELTGLKNFSLSDVFWVGGDKTPSHRLLINATFVAVNRRSKNPPNPRPRSSAKHLSTLFSNGTAAICADVVPCSRAVSSSTPILAGRSARNNLGMGLMRR